MPKNNTPQLIQLRQQIETKFNEEELRVLCFDLGVDYENLGGRGKATNVLELVQWAKRRNRLADLMVLVKAARPDVSDVVALLPTHHIPYRRNELFTGREEWLRDLHTVLYQNEPIAVTQAVVGLGGVGKTQLALAYCYRHQNDWDLIQWLRADDAVKLGTELAELAYRLGLARRSMTDQSELHQMALNWLQNTDKRWLLVYDNADIIQPKDIRPFLPKVGYGACLITSRNSNWGTLAKTVRLNHFNDVEAVTFLLEKPEMNAEDIACHPDGEAALNLAKLLGHLPLALEHARAYMAETGCTLADYADYFANERVELWGDDLPAPADYDEKTITTTWELAFAQAKQTFGAVALLHLCCFLAPDDIPLDALMAATRMFHELRLPDELVVLAESKLKLDKAIAALRRYSLLTRGGNTLALHRLVQTVARDQMPLSLRQRWADVAVSLLLQTWPYDHNDLTTWELSGEMLPHLLAAADEAEKVTPLPEKTGLLLNRAGFFLHHRVAYDLTLNLYQRSLAINEKALGAEHPHVATDLSNLGQLLQVVGKYEAARPYLERALAIDEKALGTDHPDLAINLNNLGQLLHAEGEYKVARPYLERALTISENALGPDHPQVAGVNNNLGLLLQDMGEYEAARSYLERALAISEKVLGADHPQVAGGNNNLAALLQVMGEYQAAWSYLERALAIDEKMLGVDHPSVATDLNNLGQLMKVMGEYEAALRFMKRALAIWEKALGSEHPQVATGNNNLGLLLKAVGTHEVALQYLNRALAIDEKVLGPEHPSVARDLNNLGQLLQDVGEYEVARLYMERALAIDEKALGSAHPSVARDLNNLGQLLKSVGANEVALPLMERALAIFEAKLGIEHPNTCIVRDNLAVLLAKLAGQ